MSLFTIFILGAVIVGTGALLAPAWQTDQPRIGLAAALALALVVGGSVFYASLFGWNILVVDYLLFVLVTSIFLGGTLTYGQKRAEARGIALGDFVEGWTSARDLLLFTAAALVFVIPALIFPVPLDTDAQGFGYLALMARLGGTFDTLAPFHPQATYLYAPGFIALTAYLSQQLGQGLHIVQFSVGAVLGTLLVWLAYDFGTEIGDKRLGRAFALALLAGGGLFTAFIDSHYTTLLALVFALAFLIYVLRYLRAGNLADVIAAGLMLGAVILSHPDTTIILALGYAPWLLTMWFGQPRPTPRRWLMLALAVPLIALAGIAPWLWSIRDLLGADIVSPFQRSPDYWRVMTLPPFHNPLLLPLALIGALVGVKKRDTVALLALGWLALALDFSTLGVIEGLLHPLIALLLRYDYPFSIAWHAPIIPYTLLGGVGLLWVWDRFFERRLGAALHRYAPALLVAGIVLLSAALVFPQPLLDLSRGKLTLHGAFSSAADVRAMLWLKDNTPPDVRVLNYPAPHEADWAPVIAERDSVYYRPQPFFRGDNIATPDNPSPEQERLRAFWEDPADTGNAALLAQAGIDYVIVPQVVTNPASISTLWRWREPFTVPMQSPVAAAPYLELVFDDSGAQVYKIVTR